MAFNQGVYDFVVANLNSPSTILTAMRQFGVDVNQLADAIGMPASQITSYFQNAGIVAPGMEQPQPQPEPQPEPSEQTGQDPREDVSSGQQESPPPQPTYYYASDGSSYTSPGERDSRNNYLAQQEAIRVAQETASRTFNGVVYPTVEAANTAKSQYDIRQQATNAGITLPDNWFSLDATERFNWVVNSGATTDQLKSYGIDDATIAEVVKARTPPPAPVDTVVSGSGQDTVSGGGQSTTGGSSNQDAIDTAIQTGNQGTTSGGSNNVATTYTASDGMVFDTAAQKDAYENQLAINAAIRSTASGLGVTLPEAWNFMTPQQQVDWYVTNKIPAEKLKDFFSTDIKEIPGSGTYTPEEKALVDLITQRQAGSTGTTTTTGTGGTGGTTTTTGTGGTGGTTTTTGTGGTGGTTTTTGTGGTTTTTGTGNTTTGTGNTTTTTGTGNTTTTTGTGGTTTTTGAGLNAIMQQRFDAMGLPQGTDLSPLDTLSKYDFSKAAPQLRMAGAYAEPIVMPTRGVAGAMPTYTMGRAPTREEAFMQYAFPQGVSGVTDIEDNITRGLQYARNLNLTPAETLGLINRALPANQYITPTQLQAAIEPRAGLLALAQQRTVPSVSFQRQLGTTTAGAPAGIDIVPPSVDKSSPTFIDTVGAPKLKASGGPIYYDKGGDVVKAGEKAYTLADFGISTPSVPVILPATATTNPFTGTLGVPRDVVFNKELEAKEKIARPGLNSLAYLIDLQNQGIRQGRTGKEYIDLMADIADQLKFTNAQFPRIEARGPATYKLDQRGLPIRPANYYYAEGGDVGRGLGSIAMKGYAQEMAQKGRFGDTMLAHISPEEAQMLQAAGGAGTINPSTGLPEYFSWRKLFRKIAPIAQIALPFFGLPPIATAALSGIAGGLAGPGKGFDFKRGLMSGLMSYGMSSLAQGAGAASGATEAATQNAITQAYGNAPPTLADYADITGVSSADALAQAPANVAGSAASQVPVTPPPKFGNVFSSDKGFLPQLGENIQAVGQGAVGAATGDKAAQ